MKLPLFRPSAVGDKDMGARPNIAVDNLLMGARFGRLRTLLWCGRRNCVGRAAHTGRSER